MQPSRKFKFTRVGCATVLALFAIAGPVRAGPTASADGTNVVVVEAADAITRTVPISVDSVGHVDAVATVPIVPLVNARIKAVLVADGADVKAGDPLLSLDGRAYGAQLERMRSERVARAAQVAALEARIDRSADLVTSDFVSPQQVQEQQVELAQAKAALAAAEAGFQQATIDFENCEPRAPIDGRVGLLKGTAVAGNFVAAGSDPLLEIRSLDRLMVEFTVPESTFPLLQKMSGGGGLKVVVSQHNDMSRTLEGPVSAFDNVIDPRTRSLKVRAVVPNSSRLFWPGEFVDVRLIVGTAENAVLIPTQSVNTGPKGPYVYVVEGGKAMLRAVELGQPVGDLVVATTGVKAGQKVIVSGQLGLQDGSPVQVSTGSSN